jgi:hypothetical protein
VSKGGSGGLERFSWLMEGNSNVVGQNLATASEARAINAVAAGLA